MVFFDNAFSNRLDNDHCIKNTDLLIDSFNVYQNGKKI